MIERLAHELPDVSRVKIIGNMVSVEYTHNQYRDEFTDVDQIVKALQKAHRK